MSDKLWTLGTAGAAALGVAIANKASKGVWKKATGGSVADDPQDPATGWGRRSRTRCSPARWCKSCGW